MKRILVISWYYPPSNSSEGLVTYKLLNNSRYSYDVFTQNQNVEQSFGMNMLFENKPNVHTVFARASDPISWREEAVQYFYDHRTEYDCVMTRAMPLESHEAGIRIKKQFPDVKWIASFGDPLKNYPYAYLRGWYCSEYSLKHPANRNQGLSFRLSPKRILKVFFWNILNRQKRKDAKRVAAAEDQTMLLADKTIFNNLSQQRFMAESSASMEKSVILRHSYDPEIFNNLSVPEKKTSSKTSFIYIGQLNDLRSAMPLLQAVHALNTSVDDLSSRAEFVFYGKMPDSDLAYILRNNLQNLVHFKGAVSYLDSLKIIKSADWAIHIDADISSICDENVFFAGKIADYFGARIPIISISMQQGDVVDELRNAGMLTLSYGVNELKQYLYQILYQDFQISPDWDYTKNYCATVVAEEFDRLVISALHLPE